MTSWRDAKIRSDETWRAVRRGWEAGETGASLARRFDVGLANLWRRRASEGWERGLEEEPDPEPAEGWERYAERRMAAFWFQLEETRVLAEALARAMKGGPIGRVPTWHLGFVLSWRAEHLGAETAAQDRAAAEQADDWMRGFWGPDGTMLSVRVMDQVTLEANRDDWRRENRLPDGVAESWP